MLDGHDSSICKDLLRKVIDQLPIDEAVDPMLNDVLYLRREYCLFKCRSKGINRQKAGVLQKGNLVESFQLPVLTVKDTGISNTYYSSVFLDPHLPSHLVALSFFNVCNFLHGVHTHSGTIDFDFVCVHCCVSHQDLGIFNFFGLAHSNLLVQNEAFIKEGFLQQDLSSCSSQLQLEGLLTRSGSRTQARLM